MPTSAISSPSRDTSAAGPPLASVHDTVVPVQNVDANDFTNFATRARPVTGTFDARGATPPPSEQLTTSAANKRSSSSTAPYCAATRNASNSRRCSSIATGARRPEATRFRARLNSCRAFTSLVFTTAAISANG